MSTSTESSYSPHAVPTRAPFSITTAGKNVELAMLREDYDLFVAQNGRTPGDTLWSPLGVPTLGGKSSRVLGRRASDLEAS